MGLVPSGEEVYRFGSDERIQDVMEELWGIKKATSRHTDKYLLHAKQLRSEVAAPKESVRDRQYKDIFTNGVSDEFPDALLIIPRVQKFRRD